MPCQSLKSSFCSALKAPGKIPDLPATGSWYPKDGHVPRWGVSCRPFPPLRLLLVELRRHFGNGLHARLHCKTFTLALISSQSCGVAYERWLYRIMNLAPGATTVIIFRHLGKYFDFFLYSTLGSLYEAILDSFNGVFSYLLRFSWS